MQTRFYSVYCQHESDADYTTEIIVEAASTKTAHELARRRCVDNGHDEDNFTYACYLLPLLPKGEERIVLAKWNRPGAPVNMNSEDIEYVDNEEKK